ncbi:MAG TPA: hypothetical protein VFH39_02935 [Candidatus Saccharimonadales bacterium]|nr:hypothetical protein [Candidatus Saccharimonadales bacterium]
MASDVEKFGLASSKWERLMAEQQFSVPSASGRLAIVLAYDMARDDDPGILDPYPTFEKEARDLADRYSREGRKVELALQADRPAFRAIMHDRTISDITVLGNGNLAAVHMPAPERPLDWFNLSKMTNHIKQGQIRQLFCGFTPRDLNVPFGLFAVAQPADVIAPVNHFLRPDHAQRDYRHLRPVSHADRLSYEDIKRSFPRKNKENLTQRAIVRQALARQWLKRHMTEGPAVHQLELSAEY